MTVLVDKADLNKVKDFLALDKVVAFPTETVFGLGVKFDSLAGLEKIYDLKGREHTKAITLMVSKIEEIEKYAYVSINAKKIMHKFMPGMITLILKKKSVVDSSFTANLDTIGIRIPDDSYVLNLLETVGPMWVTSANISNQPDLLDDQEVIKAFDKKDLLVVEGKCRSKVASTVVDLTGDDIKILRQGMISEEEIRGIL